MRLSMLWRGIGLVVLTGVSLTLGRYHTTASTMTATRTPSTAPKEMPFVELCSPLYQTPTYSGQSSCANNINGTGKAMTWPDIINSTIKVTINGKATHDVRIAVWTYWDDSTTVTPHYKEVQANSTPVVCHAVDGSHRGARRCYNNVRRWLARANCIGGDQAVINDYPG